MSDADISRLLGVDFSDQQLAAITAPLAPTVIVAGAGSGKTTVMAARVVWLVATGRVTPEQILGLTFTNKAAAELAARVRTALSKLRRHRGPAGLAEEPADAGEPTIATYHAFAGRLIAEHGLRLGVETDLRLIADASRFQLAAATVRSASGPYRQLSTHLATLVTDLLTLDEQLCEHLVEPVAVRSFSESLRRALPTPAPTKRMAEVATTAAKRDELLCLVEAYRHRKAQQGVMDFADQMALGARIGEQCPAAGALERSRYRVVLLDEYQDTSVAQRRMLTGLFTGADQAAGRGHPVMAVGDPCQAIYGWRGASLANLEEFPDDFPTSTGEPADRLTLSVNRRSGQAILDAANAHAAPLYAVHTGVQPLDAPLHARPAGDVCVALHETYADELAWVAAEVARVHAETPGLLWSDIGVLTHDNADAAAVHDGLAGRGVPAEVVGLGGLLATSEVTEVLAVLEVLHDVSANAALLRVLSGPRWRIGPRDLALLGRRARALADRPHHAAGDAAALRRAVSGADPAEVVCLADALDSPGGLAYSAPARERFGRLGSELRRLRGHVREPLVDLVRRVITTIGIDIELASSELPVDRLRRDNLDVFVDAVGAFAGTDDGASLGGLLAYLRAEDDYSRGLAVASPSAADSVKLLTVHKAKGLEWDVVFLPMLVDGVFPSGRGRARWVSSAKELPWPLRGDAAALPSVAAWSGKGLDAFRAEAKERDLLEERRLGYVAITRARRLLVASGHWWGPTQSRPRGPSDYLRQLAERLAANSNAVACWVAAPTQPSNPALAQVQEYAWPAFPDTAPALREAARLVQRAGAELAGDAVSALGAGEPLDAHLTPAEQARVAQWDLELDQLLEEMHKASDPVRSVELPTTLSTTKLAALHSNPQQFAADMARPMPRKPSAAARFGTRFHAWVEAYAGQQRLLEADDIPGAADAGIAGDAELGVLSAAFRAGPYGERRPYLVEAPFSLVLAGQVVRGRVDAVYRTASGWEVVDWKTGHSETADPLQLAVYRLAWAELNDVPVESVQAAFYYLRTGVVDRPTSLPDRQQLEELVVCA